MKIFAASICLAGAYLLGSIPFGLLISRTRGVDIRKAGSGNIGATNVFRCVGKTWGILAFILDFLKGLFAVSLPVLIIIPLNSTPGTSAPEILRLLCAALAVVGHNWPVWLKFKGGKGIATSAGALLGIAPLAIGTATIIWICAFACLRYVSVASILAAITVAIVPWTPLMSPSPALRAVLGLLAVAALIRHRANIKRLCNGSEHRFSFKNKQNAQ